MKKVLAVILLAGCCVWVSGGGAWADQAQNAAAAQQGVLAPENANEARLNRLQLPDRAMDAIGILQDNGMYIYLFRPGEKR